MKNTFIYAALAVLALPSLAACSSTEGEALALSTSGAAAEPSDADLQAAIQNYLGERQGPKNSQYQYTRMDLNGDGLREGIVLFNLPHNYWCGWSGCTLAVFEARDSAFTVLSETSRIRGPLVVGGTSTNGWNDIAVRLSGTEHTDRNVVLKFNGQGYPDSPLNQTILPYDLAALGGTKIFP